MTAVRGRGGHRGEELVEETSRWMRVLARRQVWRSVSFQSCSIAALWVRTRGTGIYL